MVQLFRLYEATRVDPGIAAWFAAGDDELRRWCEPWFARMLACGDDVLQCLHDGCPTACVGDAAFGYVNAFSSHVNVGFFYGAMLRDPAKLLVGSGKRMRHVKLRFGEPFDAPALEALIATAYSDIRDRLRQATEGEAPHYL